MQLGIVGSETIGSVLTPRQGFSPVGAPAPGGWVTVPGPTAAVADSITVTSTATLDWSRYGVFQFLCTNGSGALALTFVNAAVGQRIAVVVKQASSTTATTVTYPSGTIAAATASNTQALTATNNAIDILHVTCTAPGVFVATFN